MGLESIAGMAGGMNPATAGLGALESLTGGGAGPSTATSTSTNTTNNENGFKGNTLNMGSKNGLPWWVIVLGILAALWILKGK